MHNVPSLESHRRDWQQSRADMEIITFSGQSVFSPPVPEGCSQIFAPCLDPDCRRPCGARRTIPEINIDIDRERRAMGFWQLAGMFLAVGIIMTGATFYGLSKPERSYQFERRV